MATTVSSSMTTSSIPASSTTSSSSSSKQKQLPRKKKAARACIHCQKAHLTCDDSRPCQRCIKRDLASTCTDGARKKAKYLQDVEELSAGATRTTEHDLRYGTPMSLAQAQNSISPDNSMSSSLVETPSFGTTANLMDTMGLDNYNYGFGSSAANLEYSILSNMLGTNTMDQLLGQSTPSVSQPNVQSSLPNMPMWTTPPQQNTTGTPDSSSSSMRSQSTDIMAAFNPGIGDPALFPADPLQQQPQPQQQPQQPMNATSGMSSLLSYGDGAVVAKADSPGTPSSTNMVKRRHQNVTPESVYASANKPFSYAEGYHYLINYVRQKMSKEDLMRISRALALFRPSVLASMMNLTEDDLIFTEKCLQRMLLEYEKLISYSGTPTVVWRRTGEIALVGKEFSLLTQWSRETLLGKKTYIYELMSNNSAVEYWEKYALHAFDNTDSAVYSSCILLSPTKRVVPCTFCFTIKRDIFDLPSVIVGNFLPILS